MKKPSQITEWMTTDAMAEWVRKSPDLDSYQKRLAIWLTTVGPFHAHKVAEMLQISKQAVWLWIKQFNEGGPSGLERVGRGGRRKAYLSVEQEKNLVRELQNQIALGQVSKAKELMPLVLRTVGQSVSVAYVYRLLQRYNKRKSSVGRLQTEPLTNNQI